MTGCTHFTFPATVCMYIMLDVLDGPNVRQNGRKELGNAGLMGYGQRDEWRYEY